MRCYVAIILFVSLCISVAIAEDSPRDEQGKRADSALQLAAQDDVLDDEEYRDVQNKYQSLVDQFPEWFEGYSGLALLEVMRNNCEVAVKHATVANSKQANSTSFYALTLCYAKMGRYEDAVSAANTTVSLNESLTKNSEFMIHSAFAFTEVGKYEVARNLLAMILKEKPEIKSDERFLKVGRNLAARMREAGLIDQ